MLFPLFILTLICLFSGFPIIGIGVLLLVSTLETWTLQLLGYSWTVPHLGLILFLAACAIRQALVVKIQVDWLLPLVLLAAFACLSSVFSIHPIDSIWQSSRFILCLCGGYFIGLYLQGKKYRILIQGFTALSVLVSLILCAFEYFTLEAGASLHLKGGFEESHYYSVFLACLLPFGIWESRTAQSPQEETISILLIYLMTLTLVITGSWVGRCLLVALFIFSIVNNLLPKKHYNYYLPLIVIGFLHWMRSDIGLLQHLQQGLESSQFQEGIEHSLTILGVFAQHPFWGIGYGQLDAYLGWAHPTTYSNSYVGGSSLLRLFAELGLFGGIVFIGLFVQLGFRFRNQTLDREDEFWFMQAARVSCFLLALSALFITLHLHLFTWCWMGVLYGLFNQDESRKTVWNEDDKKHRVLFEDAENSKIKHQRSYNPDSRSY